MNRHEPYSDIALFHRIADGDEAAFEIIYRQYVPQLAAYIQTITHSPLMVNEFIQETFLRLWLGRDKLREVTEPRGWTFRIAAHICHNYLKRQLTEKKVFNAVQDQHNSGFNDVLHNSQVKEIMQQLQLAVNQLSPQRKKIYRLSREGGHTIPEIAELLSLSPNTVKNTLSDALEQVRDSLLKAGFSMPVLLILLCGK